MSSHGTARSRKTYRRAAFSQKEGYLSKVTRRIVRFLFDLAAVEVRLVVKLMDPLWEGEVSYNVDKLSVLDIAG